MALYAPRTQRSRSNSLAHFGSGPPTPARARTPTAAQRSARDAKPIVTLEDLLDRMLNELRKDANSLDIAGFPGSLRDRLLRLMKGFYNGPRKGKVLDPGDDCNSPLSGAAVNMTELRIEELEAELTEHRTRTAALRSEMAIMQIEMEKTPKTSRITARDLAEARSQTAFVRTQLVETKAQLRQAEERAEEAEAQWHVAEERAQRAELRVKSYNDEEQWTRLEFIEGDVRGDKSELRAKYWKENAEHAAGVGGHDGRARMIKARVDREKAALEKKGPAWKPGGVRPTPAPRAAVPTPRAAEDGSPAVSPRAAPVPVPVPPPAAKPVARSASPVAKAKPKAKAREQGPLICAYCRMPVDGSPPPKKKLEDPDVEATVLQLKKRQKEELEKLKHLERQAADSTAKHMAEQYARILAGKFKQRVLVGYRSVVVKALLAKSKQAVKEDYQKELNAVKRHENQTITQRDLNAQKMATSYYSRLLKELQKSCIHEWSTVTIKSLAFKKAQDQSKELAQLQALNAKVLERGGEIAEQVAEKWQAKQNTKLLDKALNLWERLALEGRVNRQLEQELEALQAQREQEFSNLSEANEETAENMAKKYRTKMNKDLQRNVISCWFRAAMTHARQIQVQQQIAALQDEHRALEAQYDDLSEEKEEQLAAKYRRTIDKELRRRIFMSWLKEALKGAAERKLENELSTLRSQEREHGDEIAETLATKFQRKLQQDLIRACQNEWLVLTVKAKSKTAVDLDIEHLKEQHAKEKEQLKLQLTKELTDVQDQQRQEEQELAQIEEEKTTERMAAKYRQKTDAMMLRRTNGAWFKVARQARVEVEKQKMQEQLKAEMNSQLEDFKKQREDELQRERELAASDKSTVTAAVKAERERTLAIRAEKMADVQYKKRNTQSMKEILITWHQAQVEAAAAAAKLEMQRELEELKGQARQRGGIVAEQIADRAYADYMSSILTSVCRAWKDCVQKHIAERIKRQAEEQLQEEKQKQEQKLQEEKEKLLQEKEQLKKEQQKIHNDLVETVDQELDRLLAIERKKGDETAEKIAIEYAKKRNFKFVSVVVDEWKMRTLRERARREHLKEQEEHETHLRALSAQQEKEMEEMKKQYAQMGKENMEIRMKESERMGAALHRRICNALKMRCWHAWVKYTAVERKESEEKRRREEFNAQLENLAKQDRARGDFHAEQMADMQYSKALDVLMRIIHSAWCQEVRASEALREQEAQKFVFQAEMDKLRQEQRDAGDEKAERMAQAYLERLQIDLMRDVLHILHHEIVEAHEARAQMVVKEKEDQLTKLQEARDREVNRLKEEQRQMAEQLAQGEEMRDKEKRQQALRHKEMIMRAEEHAEHMAETFRHKKDLQQMTLLYHLWHEESRKSHEEKKEAKLRQAHDSELSALKRQREAEWHRQEEFAEQMSERYYKKICQSMMEQVLQAWWTAIALTSAEREAEEQKREAAKELEELRRKAKLQGDRDAQQLAMQYERRLRADFLRDIFVIWMQARMMFELEREEERMKQQQEADLDKVKKTERLRVDAERQHLVMEYQKKLMQTMLLDVINIWSDNVTAIRADKRQRKAEEALAAELEILKNQGRQKGDKTAQMLAEKFHKKICYEMIKEVFAPWRRIVSEDLAAKKLEKMRRQQDDQMERIKREQYRRLHDQANKVANDHRKAKLEALCQKCVQSWRRAALEAQAQKITVKLTRECEQKLRAVQKKIDSLADWTASKFAVSKYGPLLHRCLFWWYHRFQLEVAEYEAQLKLEEEESKLEDDVARVSHLHSLQMDDLSAQLVKQRGQTEKWLLLQRSMWGWSEARIAVKNQNYVAEAQQHFEGDVAELARAQDRAKRELIVTASEWQLQHLKRPTMLCFSLLWKLLTQDARNQRQLMVELARVEKEAAKAQVDRIKRQDKGLALMADIIENNRNTGLQRKALGGWRDEHWRETFLHVEHTHQLERNDFLKTCRSQWVKHHEMQAETLGNFMERMGDYGALRMCMRYWHQTAWTSRILDQHAEQLSSLRAWHAEELTEAKEIVQAQRDDKQILRKSSSKVSGDREDRRPSRTLKAEADASQNDQSQRVAGGPKKRLEEGRDSPPATAEPSFKPRLRSSLANNMLDDFDEDGATLQDRLSKSKDSRRQRFVQAEEEAESAAERYAPKKSILSKERPGRKRFSFEQPEGGLKRFSYDERGGSGSSSDT